MSLRQQLLDSANKENAQRVDDLLRGMSEAAANGHYSFSVKAHNLDLCKYIKLCYGIPYFYDGEGYVIYWG